MLLLLTSIAPLASPISLVPLYGWWFKPLETLGSSSEVGCWKKLLCFEWSPPWHFKTACWHHFCLKLLSRDFCPTIYPNHLFHLAGRQSQGVKAQAAFQITYPTLLKAATGQCAYFHSNSSPAQHSQIGHPLPSPAKQTKTRKKTLLITQPPPAEFFYDDVHPASGPRTSRWGLKCSNKCSDVTYPPCHHSCDTQQKPCVMLTVSSINPAWDHFK